jgi:phage terminase large subunit GpA-like protein
VPVWLVNSNKVKDRVANKLGRTDPGGQIHFPVWLDENGAPEKIDWLYSQLTTEVRTTRGWENPSRRRNEAFDLLAYCIGICTTPQIRLDHIDWSKPPAWAQPDWDRNSMVQGPEAEGSEKPVERKAPPSIEDLADRLG